MRPARLLPIWLGVLALGLPGCGTSLERGTLSGSVRFQGKPVTEGVLIVVDEDDAVHMTSPIRSDGTFEVHTAEGKGIWVGRYRIGVAPPRAEPEKGVSKGLPKPPKAFSVPPKFWRPETSGIECEVQEGQNPPVQIDLKP
ncbi:MAG: hypothetical protein ACUVUC_15475 [Thermoguttaceae bacterium]